MIVLERQNASMNSVQILNALMMKIVKLMGLSVSTINVRKYAEKTLIVFMANAGTPNVFYVKIHPIVISIDIVQMAKNVGMDNVQKLVKKTVIVQTMKFVILPIASRLVTTIQIAPKATFAKMDIV